MLVSVFAVVDNIQEDKGFRAERSKHSLKFLLGVYDVLELYCLFTVYLPFIQFIYYLLFIYRLPFI